MAGSGECGVLVEGVERAVGRRECFDTEALEQRAGPERLARDGHGDRVVDRGGGVEARRQIDAEHVAQDMREPTA